MITLQVLERNPLLSSSPGIKFASAVRQEPSTDAADIIFVRTRKLPVSNTRFNVLAVEQALALIQATRGVAQPSASDGSTIPSTAIMVLPNGDGYLVTWGTDEGTGQLSVQAQLKTGGNAAKPEDWQTEILELEE